MVDLIWKYLGDVGNYIEPFCGSAAVLLARPHAPKIETVNDADCYLANFWRATKEAPEQVAEFADGPVNECCLHARHRWLVLSEEAKSFREKMRTDPHYFDARVAGWWCWGLCCWIGSGWCTVGAEWEQWPQLGDSGGRGVLGTTELSQQVPLIGDPPRGGHRAAKGQDNRKPRIDGGEGQYGHGVHAKGRGLSSQVPAGQRPLTGVHNKMPNCDRRGDAATISDTNRPQLADAYSRGRGVNGNDAAGTCEQRRAWLLDWFGRLRDRLRTVRVCCGDWLRVCDSESVTTRLGITGIFLDPPYSHRAGRNMKLYAVDSGTVAQDVRRYCLERGANPMMRIVLAGYAGEGHEELEEHGWEVVAWRSAGGYGNRSDKGKANAKKERLWLSPHCVKEESDLFA